MQCFTNALKFFPQINFVLKNYRSNFDFFFHLSFQILLILHRNYLIMFCCNSESVIIHCNFLTFRGLKINVCVCKPSPSPEPPKLCQELEGELCTRDKHCAEGGHCIRDG